MKVQARVTGPGALQPGMRSRGQEQARSGGLRTPQEYRELAGLSKGNRDLEE